jgi:hypothetical protein
LGYILIEFLVEVLEFLGKRLRKPDLNFLLKPESKIDQEVGIMRCII